MDIVQKLKNSQPTSTPEESLAIYQSLMSQSYDMGWVLHSSVIIGFEETVKLAGLFTEAISALDTTRERLATSAPGYIMRSEEDNVSLWGLLYSNGAVVYLESTEPGNDPLMFVWMERKILDDLQLPYVDTVNEGVWNVPERWLTGGDISG